MSDPASEDAARNRRTSILVAVIGGIFVLVAATVSGIFLLVSQNGGAKSATPPAPTVSSAPSVSATDLSSLPSSVAASPSASQSPTPVASKRYDPQTELADNRQGIPVYSTLAGLAVQPGRPSRIPFGTSVKVSCVAPNGTGFTSVNKLYKISGGTWDGDYAPANAFANGVALGATGGADVDAKLEPC